MQDLKDVTHDVHYENYRYYILKITPKDTKKRTILISLAMSDYGNLLFLGFNVYQTLLNFNNMEVVED